MSLRRKKKRNDSALSHEINLSPMTSPRSLNNKNIFIKRSSKFHRSDILKSNEKFYNNNNNDIYDNNIYDDGSSENISDEKNNNNKASLSDSIIDEKFLYRQSLRREQRRKQQIDNDIKKNKNRIKININVDNDDNDDDNDDGYILPSTPPLQEKQLKSISITNEKNLNQNNNSNNENEIKLDKNNNNNSDIDDLKFESLSSFNIQQQQPTIDNNVDVSFKLNSMPTFNSTAINNNNNNGDDDSDDDDLNLKLDSFYIDSKKRQNRLAPAPLDSFIMNYHPSVENSIHSLYNKRYSEAQAALQRLTVMIHKRQTMKNYLQHAQNHLDKKRDSVMSHARLAIDKLHAELEQHYETTAKRIDTIRYQMHNELTDQIDNMSREQNELVRTHNTLAKRLKKSVKTQLIHSFPEIMQTIDRLTVSSNEELQWRSQASLVNDDYLESKGFHCNEVELLRVVNGLVQNRTDITLSASSHDYLLRQFNLQNEPYNNNNNNNNSILLQHEEEEEQQQQLKNNIIIQKQKQQQQQYKKKKKKKKLTAKDRLKASYKELEELYNWTQTHPITHIPVKKVSNKKNPL